MLNTLATYYGSDLDKFKDGVPIRTALTTNVIDVNKFDCKMSLFVSNRHDELIGSFDFLVLEGVDIQAISDALQASFGYGTRQSQDFQAIMSQLYDVMYEFNFSLPPDYALVMRALGSLEGTAKALDPDFKVVASAYPFVIGRLLVDPDPDMRRILRELLIRNDGSVRWNRLERLITAISQQAVESAGEATPDEKMSNPLGWKSFDMCAVVAATEDLLQFILSDKGFRVRIFVVRDIIIAADTFLKDEVTTSIFDEKVQARGKSEPEVFNCV
ncbi:protein kinase superfamily protein [Actinidia rufa]|uniref:Protein kinase superfamily protein n=1 Tax=Actinidia rufa TaxID=165716 RepID=A0A7J0FDN8_9ERIC|nr:protein kinase superfamily protein [Actinidia rufa]